MDLIITAATGYNAEQLLPLLNSVERNCKTAKVLMIIHNKDTETENLLSNRYPFLEFTRVARKNKIVTKLFRTANAFLESQNLLSNSPSLASLRRSFLHVAIERYFIALDLVRAYGDSASNVLLTDSRDVLIQKDPFALLDSDLATGLESEGMTINSCSINSSWIRFLYGNEGLEKLGDRQIICSGVTIGSARAIEKYLVEMCKEIENHLPKVVSSNSIDQGIHNYLIATGRVSIDAVNNKSGLIATLGYEKPPVLSKDQSTGLICVHHTYPAIVHQYDRHSALCN